MPVIGDRPEGTDVWQRVPYNPDDYGPVSDFATDFDHADPAYNPIAPKVWKELREGGCPVAHSDRYGGMWVPLTHDTVNAVAYDTDNFTSRSVVVTVGRPGDLAMPAPIGGAPPITSDPPFHGMARRLLLPAFAPEADRAVGARGAPALPRAARRGSTDITPGETVIDAAVAYAQNIPVNVIGRMLGFPARGRASVPRSSSTTSSSASRRSQALATDSTTSATTSEPRSRTTARTLATTSPATCSPSSSTGSRSTTTSSAG